MNTGAANCKRSQRRVDVAAPHKYITYPYSIRTRTKRHFENNNNNNQHSSSAEFSIVF